MPTKLSQILRPLLTGKKHSPPHTDHDPCWLCGKWTEYLNRYYELAPNKGIEFINKMLVQGETLGQESVRIRGCRSEEISPRPLHPEEVATLKMICEGFTNKWNQLNVGEKALSSQIAAQGQDINEHISDERQNKWKELIRIVEEAIRSAVECQEEKIARRRRIVPAAMTNQ